MRMTLYFAKWTECSSHVKGFCRTLSLALFKLVVLGSSRVGWGQKRPGLPGDKVILSQKDTTKTTNFLISCSEFSLSDPQFERTTSTLSLQGTGLRILSVIQSLLRERWRVLNLMFSGAFLMKVSLKLQVEVSLILSFPVYRSGWCEDLRVLSHDGLVGGSGWGFG